MGNTLAEGQRAAPAELYQDGTTYPLGPPLGEDFGVSCTIAVTDAQAADAPVFSMKVAAGSYGIYVTEISGNFAMDGTTTAAFNGVYFERHSGIITHTGGTQITPVCYSNPGAASGLQDCQFKVTALTATSVTYEGGKFGRTVGAQTNGASTPIFVALPRRGLFIPPGYGLACRLEYAALGMALDLNINYTKVNIDIASGR